MVSCTHAKRATQPKLKQQGETDERADSTSDLDHYSPDHRPPTPAVDRGQVSLVEPAAQSVLNYLRVHSSVQPAVAAAAPVDPAQRSVMQYVRAHESVKRSPALWDQAQQAVLDYLRAHSR